MPLTSTERSRKWRERQKEDPERHRRYLEKERDRYRKRKNKGDIKGIEDMSEREKRVTRKSWRKNRRNKRKKDKFILDAVNRTDTPPNSPTGTMERRPDTSTRGRKKVRKDRAKAYREIKQMKVKLASVERRVEKYKKRLQRMKKNNTPRCTDSPRSKTDQLLGEQNVTEEVRRTLLFHHTVVRSIKEKYKNSKKQRNRQIIANVVSSKLLRKYRLKKFAFKQLAFNRCRKIRDGIDKKEKYREIAV
ncbi:splicing factor Cactin-like [Saccostrea cucullata]|uniref:splicing factor Cactin-like n=1 Tax=Saccostrea cuccullata TaxID=36930 RepID=UPI002ECFEB35